MVLYRAKIRLTAPLGTKLTSGTLFGQLCWAKREAESEQALVAWLREPEALWAVSDGFPQDLLPRPLLKPVPQSEDPEVADARKAQKKKGFVTRDGFLKNRDKLRESALADDLIGLADRSHRFAHNNIDRRTGTTPEEGGLYYLSEDWSFDPPNADEKKPLPEGKREAGAKRDIYFDAPAGAAADIQELLEDLGEIGFGRDASLGRGRWKVESVEEDRELVSGVAGSTAADRQPRLLSLSHGSAEPDMTDLRCKLVAHYGKAGPGVAGSPFKKPLLLAQPGATFSGEPDRRYGALLRNVHPGRPEIVHNAFHVTLPFVEAVP